MNFDNARALNLRLMRTLGVEKSSDKISDISDWLKKNFQKCPNIGLVSFKKYIVFFVTLEEGGKGQRQCNKCCIFFKASLTRKKLQESFCRNNKYLDRS